MAAFLETMAWPFLACLVLTGMHVYLGMHVLARKVIFVDLALAQIAALGTVWGVLLGWDIHDDAWQIKGFSLLFAVVGAAVFSITRMRRERVPHEAVIGITYAVALAATVLLSANLAHGAEEVRDLLTGSILWVRRETVLWTALLYVALGVVHYALRRPFLAISEDPEAAEAQGLRVRLWDFLFYVSFGFVVTSSVAIAGVLLVFSFLVIPAVVGTLFAESLPRRLAIGWAVGTLVSAFGVSVSYLRDLPSGPTIVVSFGGFLVLAAAAHHVQHAARPAAAVARVLAGFALAALFVLGTLQLEHTARHDPAHLFEEGSETELLVALEALEEDRAGWLEVGELVPVVLAEGTATVRRRLLELVVIHDAFEHLDAVHAVLLDEDDLLREEAVRALNALARPESAPALVAAAEREPDDYIRVEMATAVIELGEGRGVELLLEAMEHAEAREARRDAFECLAAHLPIEPQYDAAGTPETRAAQVGVLRRWWGEHADEVELRHVVEDPGE